MQANLTSFSKQCGAEYYHSIPRGLHSDAGERTQDLNRLQADPAAVLLVCIHMQGNVPSIEGNVWCASHLHASM
jgi:hypothetical protein